MTDPIIDNGFDHIAFAEYDVDCDLDQFDYIELIDHDVDDEFLIAD